MFYLLVAIINAIYGILLILTLSADTPGYYIVFVIGAVLAVLGLSGFVLWIKATINPSKEETSKDPALKNWFSLARTFDLVLILGLIFRAFVVQPYAVEGISMEPNFHDREILLVDKLSYKFRQPTRGETVIFHAPPNPQEDYIKRIIGVPGDTIVFENGTVSINGSPLQESYLLSGSITTAGASDNKTILRQTLKPNEYFAMGDNRQHSSDSREWGVLPRVNIIGRAFVEIYPFNQFGLIKNPKIVLPNTQESPESLLLPRQLFAESFYKIVQRQKIMVRS